MVELVNDALGLNAESLGVVQMAPRDLERALRSEGKVEEVADVRLATLERSGDISVIRRDGSWI